jgi:hypothetical protein
LCLHSSYLGKRGGGGEEERREMIFRKKVLYKQFRVTQRNVVQETRSLATNQTAYQENNLVYFRERLCKLMRREEEGSD